MTEKITLVWSDLIALLKKKYGKDYLNKTMGEILESGIIPWPEKDQRCAIVMKWRTRATVYIIGHGESVRKILKNPDEAYGFLKALGIPRKDWFTFDLTKPDRAKEI